MRTTVRGTRKRPALGVCAALLGLLGGGLFVYAQQLPGTQNGEWRYWGGDSGSTRYSPLDQINAQNFEQLEQAWLWRADNYGTEVDYLLRATPIYANGRLYSVAGNRRTAVAIEPATGETLWTYREPPTRRWEQSMRKNYGKGVAYGEVDGRGVIYLTTPGFFLHALDAETGKPLPNWGTPVPIPGFPKSGVVDLLPDLVADAPQWKKWLAAGNKYDPYQGLPNQVGYITSSSPPIVVNDVVVVGNAHEQGYNQTRRENVPGNILAYDAKTGKHLWKFNVIPQPGEFGHDTWLSDAWSYTGNVSTWAPMSADPELGLVYIATDPPTNDYFGGFHPGNNLFATSLVALDVKTGERRWHFQIVHHDIWNYDNPTAPALVDITVDGQRIPAIVQTTKQSYAYVLNRATGEPVWPIEEKPVPKGHVPEEWYSPTQPIPTRPAGYEMQGISEDDLIDFTPELRQKALELVSQYQLGPLFTPALHRDNDRGKIGTIVCPGGNGGTNILGGNSVDPETGILYVASIKSCSTPVLVPGEEADAKDPNPIGLTVMDWVSGEGGGASRIDGLPIVKPPYGRITAIDLNTGEHLWRIPNGDTPERFKNHPALRGVDIPNTGMPTHATTLATRTLLMYGEGRGGTPRFHAVDKKTGQRIGTVQLPAPTNTPPMTYMHEGKQYIVAAVGGAGVPGALVALRLPD